MSLHFSFITLIDYSVFNVSYYCHIVFILPSWHYLYILIVYLFRFYSFFSFQSPYLLIWLIYFLKSVHSRILLTYSPPLHFSFVSNPPGFLLNFFIPHALRSVILPPAHSPLRLCLLSVCPAFLPSCSLFASLTPPSPSISSRTPSSLPLIVSFPLLPILKKKLLH